jgi:Pectate lyase superfamily protein
MKNSGSRRLSLLVFSVFLAGCGGASRENITPPTATQTAAPTSTQTSQPAPPAAPTPNPAPDPSGAPLGSRNVLSYGALGDGLADDGAAIQAAINAALPGEVVFLPSPPKFYKIVGKIRITNSITLLGAKSLIKNPNAICPTFIEVSANNVEIRGLHLLGPQQTCGYAMIVGSTDLPVSNAVIENNVLENFYTGITLIDTDGFRVAGNILNDMNYYAIEGSAVKNGVVDKNVVRRVSGDNSSGNAYGIVLARNELSPSNPRSTDVIVSSNDVQDVPVWECYDTHGGQRILFIDNYCKNAKLGINVAFSGLGQNDPNALAPIDCEVRGNTIEKNEAEPYRDAVVFAGTFTQSATGSITSNVLIGFGQTGIYAVNAKVN